MASRVGYLKKGKVGVCCMCRNTFQCARLDKRTCSDKCRKAWQRYNEQAKRDMDQRAKERGQVMRLTEIINASRGRAFKVSQ